ncbi:hypothetical protein FCV25MIE_01825 [Fagus crenata]
MLVEFELKFAAILLTSYGCLMLLLLEKVAPDALLIKVPLVQLYISLDKDLQTRVRFPAGAHLFVLFNIDNGHDVWRPARDRSSSGSGEQRAAAVTTALQRMWIYEGDYEESGLSIVHCT